MEPLLGNTKDAMESESVYTKQQRIAELGHVLAMLKRRVCEPEPVICHQGSIANPSHEEPYALIALVRDCGGVGGKPPILPGRLRVRYARAVSFPKASRHRPLAPRHSGDIIGGHCMR